MKRKILVPLDGSELGASALEAVQKFLIPETKDEIEIVLVNVISTLTHWVTNGEGGVSESASGPVSYTPAEIDYIKKSAQCYLDEVAARLGKSGLKVSSQVRTGHADREIIAAANVLNIDIIAMSTHGRSGLSHLAFGSITEKVLRQSPVPVLTVKAKH